MSWSVTTQEDKVLPEGIYDAIIKKLEKTETKFGERVLWSFYVPDENTSVVGFASLSPSNRAKGAKWARKVLQTQEKNINWGPEELEDKPCRVYVEVSEDAEGFERNIVTKVLSPNWSEDNQDGQDEEDFDDVPF